MVWCLYPNGTLHEVTSEETAVKMIEMNPELYKRFIFFVGEGEWIG